MLLFLWKTENGRISLEKTGQAFAREKSGTYYMEKSADNVHYSDSESRL